AKLLAPAFGAVGEKSKAAAAAARDLAKAQDDLRTSTEKTATELRKYDNEVGIRLLKAEAEAAKAIQEFREQVDKATIAANASAFTLNRYGAVTLPAVKSGYQGVTVELKNL